MGGWWKYMRVMNWHGLGLVGSFYQRKDNAGYTGSIPDNNTKK